MKKRSREIGWAVAWGLIIASASMVIVIAGLYLGSILLMILWGGERP